MVGSGAVAWTETQTEFKTSGLTLDTSYWLVETRAPWGHQLLAEPVKFKIADDGTLTVEKGVAPSITVTKLQPTGANDVPTAVVTVQDVAAPHLPHAGAYGIASFALAGLMLLAMVSVMSYRRRMEAMTD